jgi:hypothetical protein
VLINDSFEPLHAVKGKQSIGAAGADGEKMKPRRRYARPLGLLTARLGIGPGSPSYTNARPSE